MVVSNPTDKILKFIYLIISFMKKKTGQKKYGSYIKTPVTLYVNSFGLK